MKRKWFLIETAGLFAADQLLKTYAEQNLDKKEERRLAGPAVLRRVHNKGMCMGVLDKKPAAVQGLSLAAAVSCGRAFSTIFRMIGGNALEILHGERLHQLNTDTFGKFIFADIEDDVLAFALSDAEITVTVQSVHHLFPGGIGDCAIVVHDTVDCPNIDTDFIGDCLKLNPVHNSILPLDFLYNYTILRLRIQGGKTDSPQ